jgi:hypothetical protein
LSPLAVRRIIQVADEDVVGSLTAVCRLDREVHKLSATHPGGDPIEQMESVVQMYEEEILEWERTKIVCPGSVTDAVPDLMQEPTGRKLVEVLEKIQAEDKAAECPPLRLVDTEWMRQATKVSCMAEEICDTTIKAGWQACAYSIYRWRLEQEVRHLYACFSGPDEEEAVAKAQKKAKTWLTKAHEGVERARDHKGLHLSEVVKTGEIQRHIAVPGLEFGTPLSASWASQREPTLRGASPGRHSAGLPCMGSESGTSTECLRRNLRSSGPVGLGQGASSARRQWDEVGA